MLLRISILSAEDTYPIVGQPNLLHTSKSSIGQNETVKKMHFLPQPILQPDRVPVAAAQD